MKIEETGDIRQSQTLVSSNALSIDESEKFEKYIQKLTEKEKISKELQYLAGRVRVFEKLLQQITDLVNRPMDYYVKAIKK